MSTENPPTPPLDSHEVMPGTLHMAYRFALDCSIDAPANHPCAPRLNHAEEYELGRRLAEYWQIKNPTP